MRLTAIATSLLLLAALATSLKTAETENVSRKSPVVKTADAPIPPAPISHSSYMSPHASPIALSNGHVFVVNTPDDTVDVIHTKSRKIVHRVKVGIDPVGIAARPDGKEVWVTNHVSDSVSIINTDPKSNSYLQVLATVQRFHPTNKSTRFDEPIGIAFASNDKAYVALSSENAIAVIDVARRKVTKLLRITAQDPRAITVQGDRLYVIPFESNNKSQLSGGTGELDKEYETFDAWQHSIAVNNVLSLGHVTDIIKHPDVPDRDLYVFDTNSDELVEVVDTLGTLLYGLTVDSNGKVFIAQADARNDANGKSGTKKHGLKELENRAFLNQITTVTFKDGKPEAPEFFNLEPLPPNHPERERALATPFAIQISDDDTTIVASAASSDTIFTLNAVTGDILGRVHVGAVPRGIALQSDSDGQASQAWVLNAVANTVSLIDVSDPTELRIIQTIPLHDPTDSEVKRGRIAFNTAAASTTGTYSCASCHPDGHTDQLLWVLNTPIVTGGDQIMPRSTMPIRGLRDTEPYHWDGIPGDPYGGNNSANIRKHVEPNSDVKDPVTSARHLIDGGLANTMMTVGNKKVNDKGQSGELSDAERDAMAKFLLSVTYPPAQRRSFTNEVSAIAREGFELFHVHGDLQPKQNVCGDCHRMPFLVSTNTPGTGMEAPTWRGAYDRWLILPQGRLNIIDFDFYRNVAEQGAPERSIWQFSWAGRKRFDPVWDMVLEGSTGFSGAFARQITLNKTSIEEPLSLQLLDSLELSAREGGIVLEADGVWLQSKKGHSVNLQFDGDRYVETRGNRNAYTREELISLVANGEFIGTFTGHIGSPVDLKHPQPALWTLGSLERQSGRQRFPVLHEEKKVMGMSGRHFGEDANLIVDGRRVKGKITIEQEKNLVLVSFIEMPSLGMHLLQVQNPSGLFSNDFIFYVKETPQ
jgi:YVTN family beta-propeller protein